MAAQCIATAKRSGAQCKRSPVPGATVCVKHGGGAPQVQAAAKRRLVEMQAAAAAQTIGLPVETSPQQALIDEVQRAAGMVAYYGARVEEIANENPNRLINGTTKIENREGFQAGRTSTVETVPNVWLTLWNEERDRLARVSTAAIRAGIEERRVELAEHQGLMIAAVIRRILDRLNLDDTQRVLVGEVVPAELRALAAGATT